jgi:anti-sigma factor RsiW
MCNVSEAELHGYADGELEQGRQEAVRRHLAVSLADAARVESWRRQNETIRSAVPPVQASQLPRSLLVSAQRRWGQNRRSWRERWFGCWTGLAFASGALVAGSALVVSSRLTEPEETPAPPPQEISAIGSEFLAKQAAASLQEFAARPGPNLSANGSGRDPGLQVPVMPAFSAEGLKLAAIRAIPSGQGQMLCFYYAKPGGGPVALCAAKANEPGETPPGFIGPSPAAAVYWRQLGADYVLLGALSEATLQKLAGELRNEIAGFGGGK